jgi:hypothetical protein
MTGLPRGRALIINNSHFNDENDTRIGSETDVTNLEALFNQLGFEVSQMATHAVFDKTAQILVQVW